MPDERNGFGYTPEPGSKDAETHSIEGMERSEAVWGEKRKIRPVVI